MLGWCCDQRTKATAAGGVVEWCWVCLSNSNTLPSENYLARPVPQQGFFQDKSVWSQIVAALSILFELHLELEGSHCSNLLARKCLPAREKQPVVCTVCFYQRRKSRTLGLFLQTGEAHTTNMPPYATNEGACRRSFYKLCCSKSWSYCANTSKSSALANAKPVTGGFTFDVERNSSFDKVSLLPR